jgi:hypothetical protein
MAKQQIATMYDDEGFPATAAFTAAITAAGTSTVKASAGRLVVVTVITPGTGILTFYDNASAASGTVLLVIPASPAAGTIYSVNLPAVNGITVVAAASASTVTIGYS